MEINKTQFELKFSFKAIKELMTHYNIGLTGIGELSQDMVKLPFIAHVGNKHAGGQLTEMDFEELFDKGDFGDILKVSKEFNEQTAKYFVVPNEISQTSNT